MSCATSRLRFLPIRNADLTERSPAQPEAQDAYLKGAAAMQSFSENGLKTAVDHFKRAIELDPQYARAYASLAHAYTLLGPGYSAMTRDESYALTRAAASRALELDERLNVAHYAMAFVTFDFEFDWPATETHLRRALELVPERCQRAPALRTYIWRDGRSRRIDQGSAAGARAGPVSDRATFGSGDGAVLRAPISRNRWRSCRQPRKRIHSSS